VNENPSAFEPENVAVGTAFLNSAAKFVGSVGSEEPGVRWRTPDVAVHVTLNDTAPGAE
jgi:hypothetical protein